MRFVEIRNQFFIFFACYVSITLVIAKKNLSCDRFLTDQNTKLVFWVPAYTTLDNFLTVEANFTYEKSLNDVPCILPIICNPFLLERIRIQVPLEKREASLKLSPEYDYSEGVTIQQKVEYKVEFVREPLWFYLYQLKINNKVLCTNKHGEILRNFLKLRSFMIEKSAQLSLDSNIVKRFFVKFAESPQFNDLKT